MTIKNLIKLGGAIGLVSIPLVGIVSCSKIEKQLENPNYKPSKEMKKIITEKDLEMLQKNFGKSSPFVTFISEK